MSVALKLDTTSDVSPGAESARSWLLNERRQLAANLAFCAARETRWSWARLVVFVAAFTPCFFFTHQPLIAVCLVVTGLSLFAVTVYVHHILLARREHADRLVRIADEALQRVGGTVVCVRDWQRPSEATDEDALLRPLFDHGPVWPLTAQERDDLDLFAAPVGIFGLLNRTSTAPGARRLRDMLEHPLLATQGISARQAAVRWLADHPLPRLHIMAGCAALRREDRRLTRFMHALAQAQPLRLPIPVPLLELWGLLSAAFVVLGIVRGIAGDASLAAFVVPLLVFNGVCYAAMRSRLAAVFDPWQDAAWAARGYLTAARCAATHLPADAGAASELAALRERCAAVIRPDALPSLYRRLDWTEGGGLPRLVANIVAFADVFFARRLLARVLPRRDDLLAGISAVAEIEALCSLAAFAWEQPVKCYPTLTTTTGVWMDHGVHPLVPPERVVPNDAALDQQIRMWIITGSNMAGKSTFLRTVALNVLLAQVGGIATARELTWRPLRLITDLRARDDLAQRESYFLAEVRHVRRMILPPAGETPVLGIMDEPFRGTDSQDQTAASLAVVQQMLASPHLFLVATHDRQLTTLASDPPGATIADSKLVAGECSNGCPARNFHFRENLAGDELVFDYRLHAGPAQTRNALRVLAREGYPDELLERAQAWLAAHS